MPIHEWNSVDAGIFHAFHLKWIATLDSALNSGLLPSGYYSLPEQHAGLSIPDLLTLHANKVGSPAHRVPPSSEGGLAVAEAPPKVQRKQTVGAATRTRRRTLAIRHVSEHQLIAIIEIVSPSNKDRAASVADLAGKIVSALAFGVHALMLDLLRPGKQDPTGMHGAVWQNLEQTDQPYDLPDGAPCSLASYVASDPVDIYLQHPSVGHALPEMPLFLSRERYINVPLEETYLEAYGTMPSFWRDVLESKSR